MSTHPKAHEEAADQPNDAAAVASCSSTLLSSRLLPRPGDVPSWDGAFKFSNFNKDDVVPLVKGWGNGKRVGVPGSKQYSPLDNFSVSSHWVGSCWQMCLAKPLFWCALFFVKGCL